MSKTEIAYLCDREACEIEVDCLDCHHTLDIRHAKNFKKVAEGKYMEMADLTYKSIKEDLVNHPSHYTNGDVETIDKMVIIFGAKETATICLGNCFKYLDRYKFKGNPQQDLEKALWYAKKAFSLLYLEKDPEEVYCSMRDFEFDVYSESFNYREFYVAEAKRDLIIIRHNQREEYLASLIRHIELAVNSQ